MQAEARSVLEGQGRQLLWLLMLLAALCVAAFSHLYIWVHYFCTERPDMRLMCATGAPR